MSTKCKKIYDVAVNDANYNIRSTVVIGHTLDGKPIRKELWKCPFYVRWFNMLTRCYNKSYLDKFPTYKDVTVCEEWLTFSNFKAWMEQQDWEGKELDKDLLVDGNKIYGPDNCIFLTKQLNYFLNTNESKRGEYLLGVYFEKDSNRFVAQCNNPFTKRCERIGRFRSELDAHQAYVEKKKKHALSLILDEPDKRIVDAIIRKYSLATDWKDVYNILTETK